MSKYRIIANDELKTVSVLFSNTRFFSAKYLLKRWQNKRYFGQGILPFSNWQEFWNFAKELSNALIQVSGIFSITPNHLFDDALVEYPVFRKRVDEEEQETGQVEIVLSVFAEKGERDLFFTDLTCEKPVRDEDEIKRYEWGVEVEFYASLDKKDNTLKIYSVLHRIIQGKQVSNFAKNDALWEGFDFNVDEKDLNDAPETSDERPEISDDDIPF